MQESLFNLEQLYDEFRLQNKIPNALAFGSSGLAIDYTFFSSLTFQFDARI